MVTTLENKRVGYIDKSEAALLAIEMDNMNKELAVKGFKLTPLARIVDCCDTAEGPMHTTYSTDRAPAAS